MPIPDVNEFWFALDDRFLFHVPDHIQAVYDSLPPDTFLQLRRTHRAAGTYPQGFVEAVTPMRDPLELLSREQLAIFDRHLGPDPDVLPRAFEEFGQGIHFDPRRPPTKRVHMMDIAGPASPPIGYHVWHAIIQAQARLGIEPERWTAIDRCVGLGWAVQSEARPVQGPQANPPMAADRLQVLRDRWMARTPDEVDAAFDSSPFPADVGSPA
jgi:hypothetical protein